MVNAAAFVAWNLIVKEFGLRCAKATPGSRTTLRRSALLVETGRPSGWLLLPAEAVKDHFDDAGLLNDGDALHLAVALGTDHHIHGKDLQE